ncbi:phosphotransferase [Schumannella luteola]|uniref:Aminoglycoside phosphotransferase (APT) family kinase protein n=1 Tax=Schumannella luteola TaxID=472059 RepID=A0A852YCF9_9MICO|nr:phosphotransferase [Schumannella luteola]NYG99522.1 aminoglycoside phosphotransferase (APT) family kinase protein [Schumannella luteola]TPX03843.1 phosphotransferase [Schumannella luteola]
MDEVQVVVAHSERATLRVGDTFVKVDGDPDRLVTEVAAMAAAPLPTAPVLWTRPSVIALGLLPGRALGRLGEPSAASAGAWTAAGKAVRRLHDSPLPARDVRRDPAELRAELERECAQLVESGILPAELVEANRAVAEAVFRPYASASIHGDLQITHVFTDDQDEITGVLDWSEAGAGDAMFDLATLTLGHEGRLDDLLAGYGRDVDRAAIRGWWSLRSLFNVRWLSEHGFDPFAPGCEVDVLRARLR